MIRRKTSAGAASPAGQGIPPHALRDYVLLAAGELGAIIGPRGEIACSAPRANSEVIPPTTVTHRTPSARSFHQQRPEQLPLAPVCRRVS
jgi:hypothetical protein